MASLGGFAGLWFSEIEISYKYADVTFELHDIWEYIELLNDKLRQHLNSKEK